MALTVLASATCDDGDCPTFFLDETTGDVTVTTPPTRPARSTCGFRDRPGRLTAGPVTAVEFDALFDSFTSTVFRLETLPAYAVGGAEEARLRAFREGSPRPERSVRTSPWLARIAASTVAGKAWSRVRVIDRPPTEYQRYQLESYRESQAVGEQISLVDRDTVGEVGVDFWLFDAGTPKAHAVLMHYHPDGRLNHRELVTDPDAVSDLDARRCAVGKVAVPLNAFLVNPKGERG